MSEHIVKSYDEDLMELSRKIAEMGGLTETMLATAIKALVRGDTDLAQRVIETDVRLDVLEKDIEEKAILTIAKRQPLAVDLRMIVSSIRLAGDLERIGDLSKNIAKRVVAINGQFAPQKIVSGVVHMSDLALDRMKRIIDAYIGLCAHLLFCAKNIERIGDHATNIAETIHYLVTGKSILADRPRTEGAYKPLDPEDHI